MKSCGGPFPICWKNSPPSCGSDLPGSGFAVPRLSRLLDILSRGGDSRGILVGPLLRSYNIHIKANNELFVGGMNDADNFKNHRGSLCPGPDPYCSGAYVPVLRDVYKRQVLKPFRPTMPPPVSASAWRARRWRPGRKEFDYRTIFCDLRRSPLAVCSKGLAGGGGKTLPHNVD